MSFETQATQLRPLARPFLTYVTAVHLLWGTLLLFDGVALSTTPLEALKELGESAAIVILLTASALAVLGLFKNSPGRWLLFMPQELVLALVSWSILKSVVTEEFADGVQRDWTFMLADHPFALFALLGHTFAIAVVATDTPRLQRLFFTELSDSRRRVAELEGENRDLREDLGDRLIMTGGVRVPLRELFPSKVKRPRVVLCEDDPGYRSLARVLLDLQLGAQVLAECETSEELLRLTEELKPDAVVTDLILPGRGGQHGIIQLRQRFPKLRIIAVSSDAGELRLAALHGADTVLGKHELAEKLLEELRPSSKKKKLVR